MDEAAVKIILHEYFGLFLIDDDEETSCIFFLVNLYGEVLKCALHRKSLVAVLFWTGYFIPKVWISVMNPKVVWRLFLNPDKGEHIQGCWHPF